MNSKKRFLLLFLSLTLVFSLTFSIVSSAYTPSEEDLSRQDMWEELNQKKTDAYDHINTPGNYYTGNYVKAVSNAVGYAEYLLYQANSTYDELKEMSEYFDFLETERDNPANQSFPYHYTVAFTNTLGWEEPIYAYVWNSKGTIDFEWPGLEMDGSYINEYGQRQYYVNVPESADYIIFSSRSGEQTVDIPLYNKTGYYPSAQIDSNGKYKSFSWHITDPVYKDFTVPVPTEVPTQTVPTETTPLDDDDKIPHLSPDDPDENYISWFLPKHDTPVKIKLISNSDSIREELYELLIEADRRLANLEVSIDDSSDEYFEKLQRVRDHSAAVYNETRSMEHELIGALKTLRLALDDAPYGRIIDYLRYYFIYIEYPVPVPDPTEAPTEPVTEPTEAPTEVKTEPGAMVISVSTGSPRSISKARRTCIDLMKDLGMESIGMIASDDAYAIFYVTFTEKSEEIVERAIALAEKDPAVNFANPDDHTYSHARLDDFVPGTVLLSGTGYEELLKDFEIESVRAIYYSPLIYKVEFKEKTTDIVWRALEVLEGGVDIDFAEPDFYAYLAGYPYEDPTEDATMNTDFEPGAVLVELKSGSEDAIHDALVEIAIESIRLITPGSSTQKVYYVRFAEKTKEIVLRAIKALEKNPNVKSVQPNYYGSYLPLVAPFMSDTFVKAVREYMRYQDIEEEDILVLHYEKLMDNHYVLRFYLKDHAYPENMVEETFGRYTLISSNPEPVIYDGEKIYTIKSAFNNDIITQYEMNWISSLPWMKVTKTDTFTGDADCDSKVTIIDATRIQRILASLAKVNTVDRENADMDGDGRVTVIDATKIQRQLASLEE